MESGQSNGLLFCVASWFPCFMYAQIIRKNLSVYGKSL